SHWPDEYYCAFHRALVTEQRTYFIAVAAGEGLPVGIVERRRLDGILRAAGVLDAAGPGDEVADGVRLRDAPGHRAGHVCVEIGGARPLVYVADTLHHESHIEHPEWDQLADEDPARALATRRAILAHLAETGARAAASHVAGTFAVSAVPGDGFELR